MESSRLNNQTPTVQDMEDKFRKIALYRRVSSDEQARSGEGLKGQEHKMREFIAHKFPNYEIVHVFSDDGVSASKVEMQKRPELMHMIGHRNNHLKKKQGAYDICFDTVVVFKGDRLARNQGESETIYNLLTKAKVEVYEAESGNHLNNNSSQNILVRQIMSAVAEAEIAAIRARVSAVKESQRASGRFAGGGLPYGFYPSRDENNKPTVSVKKEEIDVWLRIIYNFLIENKGTKIIARELNEDGIPFTKAKKRANGSQTWTHDNVLALLKNPLLTGHFPANVKETYVDDDGNERTKLKDPSKIRLVESELLRNILPTLLPVEIWVKICDKLKEKRPSVQPNKRMLSTTYLLSGLLKCSCCNGTMRGHKSGRKSKEGKEYVYYKCMDNTCPSPLKSFQKEKIEEAVLKHVVDFLYVDEVDNELLESYINKNMDSTSRNVESEIQVVKEQILLKEKQLKNLKESLEVALTQGDANIAQLLSTTASLEAKFNEEIEQLNTQLQVKYAKLETEKVALEDYFAIRSAIKYINDKLHNYDELTLKRMRSILLLLVDSVMIEEGELKIFYRHETGSEIPKHLSVSFTQDLEESIAEIIKGNREVSATAMDFVFKAIHSPVSRLKHETQNSLVLNYLRITEKLQQTKQKGEKILLTPYVSRVYKKEVV